MIYIYIYIYTCHSGGKIFADNWKWYNHHSTSKTYTKCDILYYNIKHIRFKTTINLARDWCRVSTIITCRASPHSSCLFYFTLPVRVHRTLTTKKRKRDRYQFCSLTSTCRCQATSKHIADPHSLSWCNLPIWRWIAEIDTGIPQSA